MDFFEVTVEVDGVRVKVWKFLMRLMYSGRDFARLYERCDQLSFLDGHVRGFEYFGGVPQRSIYDNLRPAVARVTFPVASLRTGSSLWSVTTHSSRALLGWEWVTTREA